MSNLIQELRRRNVFRVAGLYAVVGWLLIQLGIALETTLLLPGWFDTFITVAVIIGFPLAMIGAWAFEMTPEGLKPTRAVDPAQSVADRTGRKLDFVILGALVLLVVVIIGDRVMPSAGGNVTARVPGMADAEASIAVLPFADMSPDGDQVYFADGISEELLNSLAQVPGLAVAGRTSSFAFKGKDQDLREIGEVLSVAHILEGSVRKQGNRVRVTAQLIRADNGFHLWSETFDGDLDDIFAVQDEIANAILAELTPQLMGAEKPVLSAPRTDISAYDLYLLAQQKVAPGTMAGYEEAADALDRALEIDPDYVPALAWRGYYELMLSDGDGAAGNVPIETALENSGTWTAKALALDPTSADALFARAGWLSMSFDPEKRAQAGRYYELALAEKPNFPLARNDYAYWLFENGRVEEALEQLKTALAHDPAQVDANTNLIAAYAGMGMIDEARTLIERWADISPDNPAPYSFRARIAEADGDLAEGLAFRERSLDLAPDDPRILREYAFGLITLGEFQKVLDLDVDDFIKIRALTLQGRKEDALAMARAQLAARPDVPLVQIDLIRTLYDVGNWGELVAYYDSDFGSVEAVGTRFPLPGYGWFAAPLMRAEHPDGPAMLAAWQERYEQLIDEGRDNAGMDVLASGLRMLEGNETEALDLLRRAMERGGRSFVPLIDPIYEPVREAPAFKAIAGEMEAAINAEREKLGLDPIDAPVPFTDPGF
ncbi:hypothetical protein GCM10011342_29850 [Aquisalinus flavus]|uniref:Tetratricopeptide repeat protein n=1 Tax=Aquisalinus flavus TaxID=1526572 RepID=A0A8J2V652_9PROT|nr:tetratricopeptide repeat protein [Aquisalinus flavus]MBD0428035.1 tetratricopeptide repeat protein [Aquisalinus flavus]GGD19194.1 hypothetical protein GCM10011342_29850 [Aquisalinus flavus]